MEITTSGPNGAPLAAVELRELPAYAACNLYMTQPPQVNAEAGQNPFPYITQDARMSCRKVKVNRKAYICNLTPGTVVGFKYLNFQNVTKYRSRPVVCAIMAALTYSSLRMVSR